MEFEVSVPSSKESVTGP